MNTYDIAIVGAGVFGLSSAIKLAQSGASVVLIEKNKTGRGASGGILGAIMPHMPTRWNDKKTYQLSSHFSLPDWISEVEENTGHNTGYNKTGRVIPVPFDHMVKHSIERAEASLKIWDTENTGYAQQYHPKEYHGSWIRADRCIYGTMSDNLSARIDPRRYCTALTKMCIQLGVKIIDECEFISFEQEKISARKNGEIFNLAAAQLLLTAGHETFSLLKNMFNINIGSGIKGQGLRFRYSDHTQPQLPFILYDDGIYIVPHDDGTVAVGSSSEKSWTEPQTTDEICDELKQKAINLCPWLETKTTEIERWAGVRPKCFEREPAIGQIPGYGNIYVSTGGFKISFGISHEIADYVSSMMQGKRNSRQSLPISFELNDHLKKMQ